MIYNTRLLPLACSLVIALALASPTLRGEDPNDMMVAPRIPTATVTPAPSPATANVPASAPAVEVNKSEPTTLPTSETILQGLLHQPPSSPVIPATAASTVTLPAAPGVAPNQPPVLRLREGQNVWNRVGRLIKDEKTGQFLFAFESDGKEMKDPPIGLIPCRMLEAMEIASDNGSKAIKFKVSGELTEYRGKNFLYIRFMQSVRDLNQF